MFQAHGLQNLRFIHPCGFDRPCHPSKLTFLVLKYDPYAIHARSTKTNTSLSVGSSFSVLVMSAPSTLLEGIRALVFGRVAQVSTEVPFPPPSLFGRKEQVVFEVYSDTFSLQTYNEYNSSFLSRSVAHTSTSLSTSSGRKAKSCMPYWWLLLARCELKERTRRSRSSWTE